jgi:hypothetical protein
LDNLGDLRSGLTLAEWSKLHAGETIEVYKEGTETEGVLDWCARTSFGRPLDSDRTFRLAAYFYLPDPPETITGPPDVSPDRLANVCRLGYLLAEVVDKDFDRSVTATDATGRSLTSYLGASDGSEKLNWPGAGVWRYTQQWKHDRTSVVTAMLNDGFASRAFVAAAGPVSQLRFEQSAGHQDHRGEHVQSKKPVVARIEEVLRFAGLGDQRNAAAQSALEKLASTGLGYSALAERPELFEMVARVADRSPALEPTRRAAALFIADQLFELSGPVFDRANAHPAIRGRLEAEGATFRWAELGGIYAYTHSWLRQALRLDPDGRVGQLAFLAMMEQGFDTSGTCAGEGFTAVVREGAEYLRRRPDTAIRGDIHVMMAQAWADVVQIGSGGYDDDSDRHASEVPSARANAIKEYRLAFASPSSSLRARQAWTEAARVLAGFTPGRTHFYCLYD